MNLTLNSPQDLQVQTGDLITKGQIVSRNTLKYQELLQKEKQLESQLKEKAVPLTPPQIKIDIRKQEAALNQAKLTVAQSQQQYQQLNESLRFKTMALAEALDREKVEQMKVLEQQKREAEQKIATLTNEIKTAQEQYASQVKNYRQAEQTRQQEIKGLMAQIQGIKQQLKRLPIVAPVSGIVTKIEYTDQTNQALTAKIVVKPSMESETSLPIIPLPNVSPVPNLTLPSP
jgi:DNA repair exonuclease SbcCD ATPase subunit